MRHIPALLAVVGPLLVLGVGAAVVTSFEPRPPPMEQREMNKAGRVMNGRLLRRSVVEEMDAIIEHGQPEIVILGNSVANTNISAALVAEAFDLPRRKVATLSVPNSVGTHWYAILKNRIYANGHRPPLVLVVSPIQCMLLVQPYSESGFLNLWAQLGDDEDLIDGAVPRELSLIRKLRAGRGAVRDEALRGARDAAIGLAFPRGDDGNEAALGRVFDDAHVDMTLHDSALPIAETREVPTTGPDAVPRPEDSFLGALTDLANENGSKLVFVRTPQAPRTPVDEADIVPEGFVEATQALLASKGHTLVDLSNWYMPDSLFYNPEHMTPEGAQTMTRALIQVLGSERLYSKRVPYVVPRAPTVRIDGPTTPSPEEPGIAERLHGQWLAPGATLTASFDSAWGNPQTWRLHLVAEQFGEGASPTLTIAGRKLPLDSRPARQGHVRLSAELDKTAPPRPWDLVLSVPADGAPVLIFGLSVGRGPGALELVGRPEAHEPARAELLGHLVLNQGVASVREPDVRYAAEPPPLGVERRVRPSGSRPDMGAFYVPELAAIADVRTSPLNTLRVRCSPVRVLEDGVPLPRAHESCSETGPGAAQTRRGIDWPPGRTCHAENGLVVFSASDGQPVASGAHTYALALDPERGCAGGRWLYPGDRLEVRSDPALLDGFRGGARSIVVSAAAPGRRRAVLPVVGRVGDEVVLNDVIFAEPGNPSRQRLTFDRTLWPGDGTLVLEIDNPTDTYAMVTSAVVSVALNTSQ